MSVLIEAFLQKQSILDELTTLDIFEEEKEKLMKTIGDIAELRLLQAILERLEEKDKELFMEQIHSGTPEIVTEFLRDRIENIEEMLLEYAKVLEQEILEDIRSLKEDK